jgi:hypothetical protein
LSARSGTGETGVGNGTYYSNKLKKYRYGIFAEGAVMMRGKK